MQTQLFLPHQSVDQKPPRTSGGLSDTFDDTETIPFAKFVQQLVNGTPPNLGDIAATPKHQAPVQEEPNIDEIELPTVMPENKKLNSDAEATTISVDHQDTSQFPETPDTMFPATLETSANQKNQKKLGENDSILQAIPTHNPAAKQADFIALRSPVELGLLSQQPHAQNENPAGDRGLVQVGDNQTPKTPHSGLRLLQTIGHGTGEVETRVRTSHAWESAPLQRDPQHHDLPPPKPAEAINPLAPSGIEKPTTLSTGTETPPLISRTEGADKYAPPETIRLAQNTPQTVPFIPTNNTNMFDPKALIDRTLDGFELRTDTFLEPRPTTHVTHIQTVNRPEFATPVPRQIVDAIQARVTAEKIIEVSLNPAELGRLRLSLTPAENGLIINVMAERAETIEMIRRNLTELEQAFKEMGHKNISFSFDQDGSFTGEKGQNHADTHSENADWSDQMVSTFAPTVPSSKDLKITTGIDIRV